MYMSVANEVRVKFVRVPPSIGAYRKQTKHTFTPAATKI